MNLRQQIERDSDKSERGLLFMAIATTLLAGMMLGAFLMGFYFTHRQQYEELNAPVRLVPPTPASGLPTPSATNKPKTKVI